MRYLCVQGRAPGIRVAQTAAIKLFRGITTANDNSTQYDKIYCEKCLQHFSHFTASYGKEAGNKWVLSFVLNVRRHFDEVATDGRLFQTLDLANSHSS